jgi:hypothetical protein
VHFVWWFIQGGIMEPETRARLRRAWGFCERHAWGALLAEAAFRQGFLHGPAILYEDLMARAAGRFPTGGLWPARRLVHRLRSTGPCLMCDAGFRKGSPGTARPELVRAGQDPAALRAIAAATEQYWRPTVCGECLGVPARARCRPHLVDDAAGRRRPDAEEHRDLVETLTAHLAAYARSFIWEFRGTETRHDRAALISAVGWCSGWRGLLAHLGGGRPPADLLLTSAHER